MRSRIDPEATITVLEFSNTTVVIRSNPRKYTCDLHSPEASA
ncbi:MAG TPA: hypothetical protein VIJ15_11560 [Dermatophilaceae bacterium]